MTKLNPDGSEFVYSTYLGGAGSDQGAAVAVDSAGNAYVVGTTDSTDFPTTENAFQWTFGGGSDAFVIKLNDLGNALVYSSYLGGSDGDSGEGIAVDADGNAYVVGYSYSSDFPTTGDSYQQFLGGGVDAFVVKVPDAAPEEPEGSGGGKGGGKPCNPKKATC